MTTMWDFIWTLRSLICIVRLLKLLVVSIFVNMLKASIIAWKALGRDCTNNNGLILQIGVLLSLIINEALYRTIFAGTRYLGVYI